MVRKYFVFHNNSLTLGYIYLYVHFRTEEQNREWLPMVTMIWCDKQWIIVWNIYYGFSLHLSITIV